VLFCLLGNLRERNIGGGGGGFACAFTFFHMRSYRLAIVLDKCYINLT
jgi:hypothetical protein